MKTRAEAQRLAQLCIQIGRAFGKRVEGFLTDMDQPLGRAVGNAVEIDEARALLAGEESEPRLLRETLRLCDAALEMAQIDARAEQIIESGAALRKFDEIVAAQTSPNACAKDEPEPCRIDLISPASGYVERLDALTVGRTAMRLGAGRSAKGEPIDHRGGIWLSKVQGEPVRRGDALATLSASAGRALAQETLDLLLSAYTIGEAPSAQGEDPILERIN